MRTLALWIALAACGGQTPAPAAPGTSGPPKLADLGWLTGTWRSAMVDAHWENVAGALYGVTLADAGFEIIIVDDSDDNGKPAPITLVSIDNGHDAMTLDLKSASPAMIEFADAKQRAVRIMKTAAGFRGRFTDEPGRHPVVFDMQPGTMPRSTELEDLDRAFDDETAKSGADGWMKYFAEGGATWEKGSRLAGAAMHDSIAKTLTAGGLRWTPVSSGVRGDTGFTLGTWVFGPDSSKPVAHGSYCTVWHKQADGSWKIVFDIGRPGDA